MKRVIREDNWLEELRIEENQNQDAMTPREIMRATGRAQSSVEAWLRREMEGGRVERVQKLATMEDGRRRVMTAYRPIKPKGKK